jgi:hypothetical protein
MRSWRIFRGCAWFKAVFANTDGFGVIFELPDTFGIPPKVNELVKRTTLALVESHPASLKGRSMVDSSVVRVKGTGGIRKTCGACNACSI